MKNAFQKKKKNQKKKKIKYITFLPDFTTFYTNIFM